MTIGRGIAVSTLTAEEAQIERNGGYLAKSGAHSLELISSTSNVIEVASRLLNIASEVASIDLGSVTLMNSDGSDSSDLVTPATLYYVYVNGPDAIFLPNSLALSTTAPQLVSGIWPACPYLDTTEPARNCRYVGMIYTDGSGDPQDTPQYRCIANHYNRRARSLYVNPGFSDGNSQSTYSFNSATWAIIHASALVQFVVSQPKTTSDFETGDDLVQLAANVSVSATPASVTQWGISLESATQPLVSACLPASAANSSVSVQLATENGTGKVVRRINGPLTARIIGMSNGASTLIADFARNGATADVPATYLSGWVMQ